MDLQKILDRIRIRTLKPEGSYSVEHSFARLMERISLADVGKLRRLNTLYRGWAVAASIALLFAVSFLVLQGRLTKEVEYAVETNVSGRVKQVLLADGSKVMVNVGSKLIYPKEFSTKNREVFLTGEAYFEVSHNKHKPFIVRVGDIGVKVLGTKFNVKAYTNDVNITTTLLEGSVQVDNSVTDQSLTLEPNEVFTYNQLSHASKVTTQANATANVLWLNGVVQMDQMSFEEICIRLERVYKVRFIILNESLRAKKFTGEFRYGEDLTSFLEVLKITTPFTYTVNQQTIILK
jgi:transmembrane sensor